MVRWDDTLWLFTPEEFYQIPDGTQLKSISGDFSTKGVDNIDMDTRFGHIAFGVENPSTHALADLFLTFKLKGH